MRLVKIIGEAAFFVSLTFRDANPHTPWIPIMKSRHLLVHDYGVIGDEKVWRVATIHVAVIFPLVDKLLPPPLRDSLSEAS